MLILLAITSALVSGASARMASLDAESVARQEIARAESLVRAGRYAEARAVYTKIAHDAPETLSGEEARRRSQPSAYLGWADVLRQGPSANRVDLVIMGDGYELEHLKAFDEAAADLPHYFELEPTLNEYFGYFNFLRAVLVSKDAGVDGFGRDYDTALGAYTRGTERGHTAVDAARVREVLDRIPENDGQALAIVKGGYCYSSQDGIATLYGTDKNALPHQLGHSFGRLGDEYPSATWKCEGDWFTGPNLSDGNDPKHVPWRHWLEAKRPGIDVVEGAAGRVHGAWRSTAGSCAMGWNRWYCVVCREAMVLRIYVFVDPIEAENPPAPPPGVREPLRISGESRTFDVRVMQPATHKLEVRWWVLRGDSASTASWPTAKPRSATTTVAPATEPRDRTQRGPLPAIAEDPMRTTLPDEHGRHELRLHMKELAPGRWCVVCRARDTTLLRDEKWPWVLYDPKGLLESERVWWIEVPAIH